MKPGISEAARVRDGPFLPPFGGFFGVGRFDVPTVIAT
jgi:hypothetical protein